MIIYLAEPIDSNKSVAEKSGLLWQKLADRGFTVFSPARAWCWSEDEDEGHQLWLANLEVLERCDLLLIVPGEHSVGIWRELQFTLERQKPVVIYDEGTSWASHAALCDPHIRFATSLEHLENILEELEG